MLPGSQPEARLFVGYTIKLPDPVPTYDEAFKLTEFVQKLSKGTLEINGGCAEYCDSVDWSERMNISELYLGITIASAYGDPEIETFTLDSIIKAQDKLAERAEEHSGLCAQLHEDYPFIPAKLFKRKPVVVLLFNTGSGQADASLGYGTYGTIKHDGDAWALTMEGNDVMSRELTAEVNTLEFFEEEPKYAFSEICEWLNKKDKRFNTHGRLDWGSAGFLFTKNICTLLEGNSERVITMRMLKSRASNQEILGSKFVMRSDSY